MKGTKRQLDNESEDDAEIGNMIQQLSQQQKAAASRGGMLVLKRTFCNEKL